ncbi:hypothetical protein [Clostridium sp.]|uniref:hypothetical protein n=1 Tax=Clostridium sp. TaxID=1506 RepID=UPI0025C37FB6|nr:hypothetical protein [Clostridium sp.]
MEDSIVLNSKRCVAVAKKNKAFIILLKVSLGIIIISNLIKLIAGDFNFRTLLGMFLPISIVVAYLQRPSSNEHYEFALAQVDLNSSGLEIIYKGVSYENNKTCNEHIIISNDCINKIEYSDKLIALRFTGSFKKKLSYNPSKVEDIKEWVLYIDNEKSIEVINKVEEYTKKKIEYVDREVKL